MFEELDLKIDDAMMPSPHIVIITGHTDGACPTGLCTVVVLKTKCVTG
jgi:hypothetical protein